MPAVALRYDLEPATLKAPRPRRRKRTITVGDLIAAACEIGGSAQTAARLLAPGSPLVRCLDRRIVLV
jgi:hypothetical protein